MARDHTPRYEKAKNAFLYGDASGKRLTTPQELCDEFGLNIDRTRMLMKEWVKEHAQVCKDANRERLGVVVSAEDLEADKRDAKFLRIQLDILQEEIDACGEHTKFLEDLIDTFDWTDKQMEAALTAFKVYLNASGSRKSKLEHYLKVHSKWRQISGVEDKLGTADTYEKEIARATARDNFVNSKGKKKGDTTPKLGSGGFFSID